MAREPLPSRCGNCRYFGQNSALPSGECRRHAPRGPVAVTEPCNGFYVFPPVGPREWCGEYIGKDGFLFASPTDLPREIEDVSF